MLAGEQLLREAHDRGLQTRVVIHSSMAQHGGEAHEARLIDRIVALCGDGVVGRMCTATLINDIEVY